MNIIVYAGEPGTFAKSEIDDFVALVLAGGEVRPRGLRQRVLAAEQIAFLREQSCLLGVAGLKNPSTNYRRRIESGAKVSLESSSFPFELGWVFVMPSARGRKLSLPLCQPLVGSAGQNGILSTSKTCNTGMHQTLFKLGFVRMGSEWQSQQSKGNLVLFVRQSK